MRNILILLSVATLALAGCAGTPPSRSTGGPDGGAAVERMAALAQQALERGEFRIAAREFSRLAGTTEPPQRQHYQLSAAEALLKANLFKEAGQVLGRVDDTQLTAQQHVRMQLAEARIALAEEDPDRALSLLEGPRAPAAEPEQTADLHLLRARAYAARSNHLEAAREYVLRELFLTEPDAVQDNHRAIWDALAMISRDMLAVLRTAPPPDVFSGWMDLARIAKTYQTNREALAEELSHWRTLYPNHPAAGEFVASLLRRSQELHKLPEQIALLLPLTGRFSTAAAAVREGVFAAHYDNPNHAGIRIRVYDVGENPNRVTTVYEQALRDGARAVIGPLNREAVEVLAGRETFEVPTLALNFTDAEISGEPADNFYQFALSPEDEAVQTAERAWLVGFSNAAAIVPEGDWGDRLERAFSERWEQLGGRVVAVARYSPQGNDFSRPLKGMLGVAASQQRHRAISGIIGTRPEFIPRRRQDLDFAFLAAQPRQARLIRPQMKFHHASDLPLYATSHVFSGEQDRAHDRDMNGVVFGDMPWTLSGEPFPAPLRSVPGQLQRLVAMGVDAYDLLPALGILSNYPFERLQGVSGNLRMDEDNRIRRLLTWAEFVRGRPRVLESAEPAGY